ncbi:MAG: cysteine desulfurase [Thermoleophilia bacterium]|nr:cysteine desulfurase [Thermoleophilia bacterium]
MSADFPILTVGPNTGQRLAYLDSAASAQKPVQVLDAMRDAYETAYANVHRGVYAIAAEATSRFEGARETARRFIGATTPREVIFTRGTTEAVNLVAYAWGDANVGPGDVVVVTDLEHHSNFVPWQQLALRRGAKFRSIPVDDHGVLDLDALDAFAREGNLKIVAVGHVSNSLGTVNPVAEIARRARELGALTFVDGAQSVPHRAVNVVDLGCDFYAFSGHKAVGPSGIGVLWGREELLASMPPFQYGGEMIRRVSTELTTFNDLPWKFEAGTPAIVEAIGLGAALTYLENIGMGAIEAHERKLTTYLYDTLADAPAVKIHGPGRDAERGGVVSFTMEGTHPHDIATLLDAHDVNVRAGHHCTQPLMARLGLNATARASIYIYSTTEDIDRLATGLAEVRRIFGIS